MDLLGNDYPYSTRALTGKHALVCGASKGIGAATAKMLAKAGADVTVCARNEEALKQVCQELESLGSGHHQALALDLEDTESIRETIGELLQQRGITSRGVKTLMATWFLVMLVIIQFL